MPCISGLVIMWVMVQFQLDTNYQLQVTISTSGTDIDIFQKHQVNTMAADALDPCATRPSTAMVLTMYD